MKLLGIFGTSGFAREVNDIAINIGYQTIYIARDKNELDNKSDIGKIIIESDIKNHDFSGFSIGIGDNIVRHKIASRYKANLDFVNLIHPSATFGDKQLEKINHSKGIIICSGVRFTNNIKVGDFSIFNLNTTVGHDAIIDEFVNVSPGANISGNVHVMSRTWIGTGTTINQGDDFAKIIIGHDTMIGSGSVVTKNCESNAVYVGAPARRIK